MNFTGATAVLLPFLLVALAYMSIELQSVWPLMILVLTVLLSRFELKSKDGSSIFRFNGILWKAINNQITARSKKHLLDLMSLDLCDATADDIEAFQREGMIFEFKNCNADTLWVKASFRLAQPVAPTSTFKLLPEDLLNFRVHVGKRGDWVHGLSSKRLKSTVKTKIINGHIDCNLPLSIKQALELGVIEECSRISFEQEPVDRSTGVETT